MNATDEPRYFNRELSWLQFNKRVLEEAANPRHPLLERVNFLSISGNNLDEFFMVRVAGLIGQVARGVRELSIDGLTPAMQLAAIDQEVSDLAADQQRLWKSLRAELAAAGIKIVSGEELSERQLETLARHFREEIFPVITLQALDPAHPFPFIPNLTLSLIFEIKRKGRKRAERELILIPQSLPRFVRVPGSGDVYLPIETLIRHFAGELFRDCEVLDSAAFRIIRDGDIELEDEAEDLVLYFRNAIKRRRRGRVIRMRVETGISPDLEDLIRRSLGGEALVDAADGLMGLADLSQLLEIDRPDLRFPPFAARFPERIREHDGDCFAAIRQKDIVVHHPYEAFDVVVAFLMQAAADPSVVAIKQTLYRAGRQSAVVRALCEAAEAGKSVTAVVELKARFDEEQNLAWAAQLERAGVQVVYGFIEWKTHAKISMVVRREGKRFRTYCHFGTGNYHPVTAGLYTDLSFFTADPRAGRDAAQVFNYITGYVEPHGLELLTISPKSLRKRLVELIDREIASAAKGKPAAIWAKMNSLTDAQVIDKLYEASAAGVQIDLMIRGICCLRPGVEGLSANIRVKSIVGRFLEHSRIWAFANGAGLPDKKAEVFISSADWMPRNFDRRIEVAVPLENSTVHDQVLGQVLVANLLDDEQSWLLQPDGSYVRVSPGEKPFNLHRYFMTNPSLSGRGASRKKSGAVPRLKLSRKG
jgi:polyphosphate kinase